jgi:hypothetical protein
LSPDDRPPCRSLFTTAIYPIEGVEEIQELGPDDTAMASECRTANGSRARKKNVVFEVASDVRQVIYFFRELIGQLDLEQPDFHPFLGWNIAISSPVSSSSSVGGTSEIDFDPRENQLAEKDGISRAKEY